MTAGDRPEQIRRRRAARRAIERRRRRTFRRRRLTALLVLGVAIFGAVRLAGSLGGGGGAEAEAEATGSYRGPVPILMYHVISTPQPGTAFPELFVKPYDFERQMSWLSERGYAAVTLRDAYDAWFEGAGMPERPVIVSFDDGLRSHYTEALPTLEEHDWPGVLNLKVAALDQGELSAAEVGEMAEAGWQIDSHTISHPDLTRLDPAELRREVAASRRLLRQRLDVPIDFFCYPGGRHDRAVVRAVKAAGYLGATGTEPGLARPSQLYELRRIRISNSDGLRGFVAKMKEAATGMGAPKRR